ncbi:MAG: sulfur carrier protein ThiS [Actinobacteria bacterium]|nr:MAG: sulfur carrier protein ThiS [Actinomycetota bacterium]
MKIILNGHSSDVRGGESVLAAIKQLGLPPDARGVAVAVDGEVIPRARWEDVRLSEGARVEVLSAMQGG